MRIVIKIGSNIIADSVSGLNTRRVTALASNISAIQEMGHEVVVVSSGAIAAGMKKLGMKKKPTDVKLKQAAAAVGQSSLIQTYERSFGRHKKKVAQVLLTRDGLHDRKMYINAKNTLLTLLAHDIVPIVNENDTVAVEEIKFGDNDNLAALVAQLVEADRLVILSDVDGLYTSDPSRNKKATLISIVEKITGDLVEMAGASASLVGTGGMYSKLLAAKKAVDSGVTVNIINGRRPSILKSLIEGKEVGTAFTAKKRMESRKSWIAYGIRSKGSIVLDDGAVKAVTERQKSLLPSGIVKVKGTFQTGDAIYCLDKGGNKIAKGLTNYSSDEIQRIIGKKTSEIEQALGYRYSDEVIHRDNLVLS